MAYFNFAQIDNTNDGPDYEGVSGRLEDYDFSGFTRESFLEALKKGDGTPAPAGSAPHMPTTIPELYAICTQNPPETQLTEELQIKDVFCGLATKDYYADKFDGEGLRLMELRYYDCDPESDLIFFKFPYTEKRQFACTFNARMFINNPLTFNRVLRRLYGYPRPILIYGSWELAGDLMASIETDSQAVRA